MQHDEVRFMPIIYGDPWEGMARTIADTIVKSLLESKPSGERTIKVVLPEHADADRWDDFLNEFDDHVNHVAYLEEEVRRLRNEVEHQYKRAERAERDESAVRELRQRLDDARVLWLKGGADPAVILRSVIFGE